MEILVWPPGHLSWNANAMRCALGRGGIGGDKKEGDGVTPLGCFPLRRVMYRADRMQAPKTGLEVRALGPDDGWCDAPEDSAYNRPVRLPYPASAEAMWRDDGLYDFVVVVGQNDDPVVPHAGSAIFLHVAGPDYRPTAGCVALARADLSALLQKLGPEDRLVVPADQAVPRWPKIAVPTRT